MCGRYAASANPDDLVEEFEVDTVEVASRSSPTTTSRRPSRSRRDHPPRPGRRCGGAGRTPPAGDALGARPVLGQGHQDRQPAHQRAGGDGRGEAGVPQGARRASVPAARGRLLRVVPDREDGRAGKPRSSRSSSTRADGGALAMAGLYEMWRDPTATGRTPKRGCGRAPSSRPTAEDAVGRIHDRMPMMVERGALVGVARPRASTTSTRARALLVPAAPGPARGLSGVDPRQQGATTTASSCSTRCP